MIERVAQSEAWRYRPFAHAPGQQPSPLSFNFPRASLLEYAFRVAVQDGGAEGEQIEGGVDLKFGDGNPPDFGLAEMNTQRVFLPTQQTPKAGTKLEFLPWVTATFARAFDALSVVPVLTLANEEIPGSVFVTVEHIITVSRPEDVGPTYTTPYPGGG